MIQPEMKLTVPGLYKAKMSKLEVEDGWKTNLTPLAQFCTWYLDGFIET